MRYGFETSGESVNWTIAAKSSSSLVPITTLDELCDLALFALNPPEEYWTPVRRTADGKCQWGLNETHVGDNCMVLLDKGQPGDCYVLSIHSMKLQPRNCSNSYYYMSLMYPDNGKL